MEKVSPCWKHSLLELCSSWPWCPHSPNSSWEFSCLVWHMNGKTFLFLAEWFPPCVSIPHHGWLFGYPYLSWPLNQEEIFFWLGGGGGEAFHVPAHTVWSDSTFCCLPSSFSASQESFLSSLESLWFQGTICLHLHVFLLLTNIIWWMFSSSFTGIYEKLLRSPFRS